MTRLNRRVAFGRIGASVAAPLAAVAGGVQAAAQSTITNAPKVGHVLYEVSKGAKYAYVWTGRAYDAITVGGPGWRTVVAEHSTAQLGQVAVQVAGTWEWANKFVGG